MCRSSQPYELKAKADKLRYQEEMMTYVCPEEYKQQLPTDERKKGAGKGGQHDHEVQVISKVATLYNYK